MGLVMPGLLIAFLSLRTAAPLRDQDTFWHLASGRQLRGQWTFQGPDPFSDFTTDPWIRHAWLPDVGFALAQQSGGDRLVALLLPIMTSFVLIALYLALRSRGAGVLLSCVLLGIAFIGMSGSLSARPQVLSFGFTAAVTALWLHAADQRRPPWSVIPLTWFWASCHGLWVLSPLIGGAVSLGLLLARRDARLAIRCAAVVLASLVVAALTPVGPLLLATPFRVGEIAAYIEEWQPPEATSAPVVAVIVLIGAVLLTWGIRRRPGTGGEIILLLACVPLAGTARRTVGVAAVIAVIVAARALQESLSVSPDAFRRTEVAGLGLGAALGAAASWLVLAAGPATQGFPDGLSRQLAGLGDGTVVCNDYEAGSWLLWRHPGLRPVVDGRTELFTPEQLEAAVRRTTATEPWDTLVRSTGCTAAVVSEAGPGSQWFADQAPWRFVGSNEGWALFERPS